MKATTILVGALAALWLAAGPAAAQGRKLGASRATEPRKLGVFPGLEVDGERVVAKDLPALSKDGQRVAVLLEHPAGESGLYDATLLVIEVASDERVYEQPIMNTDATADVDELVGAARREVRKANKYLKAREWVALEPLSVPPCADAADADAPCDTTLEVGAHRVRWNEPRLAVNKRLSEHEEWAGARRCVAPEKIEDDDECEQWCQTSSRLTVAAVDRARRALLVGLEYPTRDAGCPAGVPQWHVIALPPAGKVGRPARSATGIVAPVVARPTARAAKPPRRGDRQRLREDQRACMDGDGDACQASGEAWDAGEQGQRSPGFARLMYRRACLNAVGEGCRKFADLTTEHDDGEPAARRARRYLEKGCDLGDEESCRKLERSQP